MVGTVKTTIRTTTNDIIVSPSALGDRVMLELVGFPNAFTGGWSGVIIRQDQIGALIFGLEQAAEAAQIQNARRLEIAAEAAQLKNARRLAA